MDGTVVDTLSLIDGYDDNEMRGMAFDPYLGRLYLTIDASVYVVQVNYGATPEFTDIFRDGFGRGSTVLWSAEYP